MKHRSLAEPRTCGHCSKPLVTRFQVKFCNSECSSGARRSEATRPRGKRANAVIEDVQWIIGTDSPESIARRVGYSSVSSLTRSLTGWGERELALRLGMEDRSDYDWSASA